MTYSHILAQTNPAPLVELLSRARSSVWIGSLSFEDRCLGALTALKEHGIRVSSGVLIDYPSEVAPELEGRERKERNLHAMNDIRPHVFEASLRLRTVLPYSFYSIQHLVAQSVEELSADALIIDISCLTKIHTVSLAAFLTRLRKRPTWFLAYSVPENYIGFFESSKSFGWKDIIVAPISESAVLFNEVRSRGILIPGHEGDRLIVALGEIEPSGGVIVMTQTRSRPELCYISERNNKSMLRHLTKMRASDWSSEYVDVVDFGGLRRIICREIELARQYQSPVILFPFGPKLVIFVAAMQLRAQYGDAAWFVYPVPSKYGVDYTEGIERTIWMTRGSSLKS